MQKVLHPTVIQGGMGAGVSNWRLANAVASAGQLGVVAGTALDLIMTRRLQAGDLDGSMRRALEALPLAGVSESILKRFFIPGGKPEGQRFRDPGPLGLEESKARMQLIVAANFVEVYLAKLGHSGVVGINYLAKIQLPTLPSLFGAMLAEVDYVLMGAGMPRTIPGVLDQLARAQKVELSIDVAGSTKQEPFLARFDPAAMLEGPGAKLKRPFFFGIVSSVTAASVLARKSDGRVDGLVIEGSLAGGHNAPPRGAMRLNAEGEPIFGERDQPDLGAIAKLGLPFWLAGGWSGESALPKAQALGAAGIQVGTAFAFCMESGILPRLKQQVLEQISSGQAHVITDPLASPTGFPFKLFELEGTLCHPDCTPRERQACDLGYLRSAYLKPSGALGWRCAAESSAAFLSKQGKQENLSGRKCVCNGLMANIGLGQVLRNGELERPLLTSGSDLSTVEALIALRGREYSACDVLEHLLGLQTSPN